MKSHIDNIHHSHGQKQGYPHLTSLIFLNDDYEGGDFVLYEPTDTVLPKNIGDIYTFNHSLEHEVLEVTKGHRWSLIGFYFYEHLDLRKPLV